MKEVKEYILEAIVKGKLKQYNKNIDNVDKWLKPCKDFCYAGAWNYITNKNVTAKIMREDFIEDAKNFNIDSWKTSDTYKEYYYIPGYELAMALLDKKPKDEILKIYNSGRYTGSNPYWFQDFSSRYDKTNYGFVIEALLLISYAIYKGVSTNLWCGGNLTSENFKNQL